MSVDPRAETIRLLTSIDRTLQGILSALQPNGNQREANDAVCNGPHGDPIVKAKDPRDWSGEPMQGKHFSECPPAYLDLLADRYDYFATKAQADAQSADDEAELQAAQKSLKYAKLDGQRARAWAARLRSGWTPPAPSGRVDETMGEPQW